MSETDNPLFQRAALSAMTDQGKHAYLGVDDWRGEELKKGTKLYQLDHRPDGEISAATHTVSQYFIDEADFKQFLNHKGEVDARAFAEAVQVSAWPNADQTGYEYPARVTSYTVERDLPVAISKVNHNPVLGDGGIGQVRVFPDQFELLNNDFLKLHIVYPTSNRSATLDLYQELTNKEDISAQSLMGPIRARHESLKSSLLASADQNTVETSLRMSQLERFSNAIRPLIVNEDWTQLDRVQIPLRTDEILASREQYASEIIAASKSYEAGDIPLGDLRRKIIEAAIKGQNFIGQNGSPALGATMAQNRDLRAELTSAQLAVDKIKTADQASQKGEIELQLAAQGVRDRVRSNPFIEDLADQLALINSDFARMYYGTKAALRFIVPPENKVPRLSDEQLKAGINGYKRTRSVEDDLRQALKGLYKDPAKALEVAKDMAFSPIANPKELSQGVAQQPEMLGELKAFKTRALFGREDRDAKGMAVCGVKNAMMDYTGTVQYYATEIREGEAEISEALRIGVGEPSRELTDTLARTPLDADMAEGLSSGRTPENLVSESKNLLKDIERRKKADKNLNPGGGLTAQIADRLKQITTVMRQVHETELLRSRNLHKKREGPTLNI